MRQVPGALLLLLSLAAGLGTFRDYGLSWDEPLFYDYAADLGYAYSPAEWFSGDFDLERSFGASAGDHANRGPGYLLLARIPALLLQRLGLDLASAWHLTNFVAFQLGAFIFYQLCLRWLRPWPAAATTALFATQPLLWGHAFINPKDPPFLVLFIASVWIGLECVDTLSSRGPLRRRVLLLIGAGLALGLASAVRLLAPLAGLLVVAYAAATFSRARAEHRPRPAEWLGWVIAYVLVASVVLLAAWPYLWPDPLGRLTALLRFASSEWTQLAVLFQGNVFHADALPRRYLPTLLALTLTEPVWPLAAAGVLIYGIRRLRGRAAAPAATGTAAGSDHGASLGPDLSESAIVVAWFALPALYVLIKHPPLYDGFRHYLFILPPVFLSAGIAIDAFAGWLARPGTQLLFIAALLLPSLVPMAALHPYEYAFYNSLVGRTGGAFRQYETDYWLTCYKEALESLSTKAVTPYTVYVRREAQVAAYYASQGVQIGDLRTDAASVTAGDFVLVNTRSNEDLRTLRDAPVVLTVGRAGALFCLVKQPPGQAE